MYTETINMARDYSRVVPNDENELLFQFDGPSMSHVDGEDLYYMPEIDVGEDENMTLYSGPGYPVSECTTLNYNFRTTTTAGVGASAGAVESLLHAKTMGVQACPKIARNMLSHVRRLSPQEFHPTICLKEESLDQNTVFKEYNSYLNQIGLHNSRSNDRPFLSQRAPCDGDGSKNQRLERLEELVDKFWIGDGRIDEDMFEDSSDEEDAR
ncbi:Spl2p Ecym_6395 [Eremothecium cymbalariae DBVPG|uniref:Uncharacterized protein n=1 Tax=Eremothecium cymbalariae (strain CBS 270.75 / DBVPG 7215 / KCTC 17166 / NRRL Y-17582) TaxID=931890 RepID=G8JUI9_ERECY|nr:hypothetical protein Ecym_6395 [Eremothecium cymbalariae DBVPG\